MKYKLWGIHIPIFNRDLLYKSGGDRVWIFILHILIGEKSAYMIFYMCDAIKFQWGKFTFEVI